MIDEVEKERLELAKKCDLLISDIAIPRLFLNQNFTTKFLLENQDLVEFSQKSSH